MVALIFLIFVILGSIVFVLGLASNRYIIIFIGVVLVLLSFFASLFLVEDNSTYTNIRTDNIISLSDGSKVSGKFSGSLFLMRGSIDQKPMFFAYAINDDGNYFLDQYDASRTEIIYTNEQPRVEFWADYITEEYFLGFKLSVHKIGVQYYKIYIPEDSIVETFNLDGQL